MNEGGGGGGYNQKRHPDHNQVRQSYNNSGSVKNHGNSYEQKGDGNARNQSNQQSSDNNMNTIQHCHRRTYSSSSTASSLSMGGLSMSSSYESRSSRTDTTASKGRSTTNSSHMDSPNSSSCGTRNGRASPKSRKHSKSSNNAGDERGYMNLMLRQSNSGSSCEQSRFDLLSMDDPHLGSNSGSYDNGDNNNKNRMSGSSRVFKLGTNLSTSPILGVSADPGITPISKNTSRNNGPSRYYQQNNSNNQENNFAFGRQGHNNGEHSVGTATPTSLSIPTPPPGNMSEDDRINHAMREHSFTPLPMNGNHGHGNRSQSPSGDSSFMNNGIENSLSWSIAGDTSPMDEINGEWGGGNGGYSQRSGNQQQRGGGSGNNNGPSSSSNNTHFWKDEHGSSQQSKTNPRGGREGDNDFPALSALSPNSDTGICKSPPLPIFFEPSAANNRKINEEERENMGGFRYGSNGRGNHMNSRGPSSHRGGRGGAGPSQYGDHSAHIHHMFVTNGGRTPITSGNKIAKPQPQQVRSSNAGPPSNGPGGRNGMPTFEIGTSGPDKSKNGMRNYGRRNQPPHSYPDRRDDNNTMPLRNDGRSGNGAFYPSGTGSHMFSAPPHGSNRPQVMSGGGPNDRVRNLRGRAPPPPPGSSHHSGPHAPPHHVRSGPPHPHMSHPHGPPPGPPLGGHKGPMPPWITSSHPHPPHMMQPLEMLQSKRKCVQIKPPIPSKFQGDIEKVKDAPVPEFTSLVNYPAHMAAKLALAGDGMKCCVMCGKACPCSASNKGKKGACANNKSDGKASGPGALAKYGNNHHHPHHHQPLHGGHKNTTSASGNSNSSSFAIIPTQNKGLCTFCDVNVWVVVQSGLEIKWCKGCKNFRPWAAFGDKGLATKCVRCRERQREKYALQKEEKEKARMDKVKNSAKAVMPTADAVASAKE